MKVAVIGSRSLTIEHLEDYLPPETTELVSGGAKGTDSSARSYALAANLPIREFLPEYERYGRAAPLRRNQQIIEYADLVLAFWDGESRGTFNTLKSCLKKNIPFRLIYSDPFEPHPRNVENDQNSLSLLISALIDAAWELPPDEISLLRSMPLQGDAAAVSAMRCIFGNLASHVLMRAIYTCQELCSHALSLLTPPCDFSAENWLEALSLISSRQATAAYACRLAHIYFPSVYSDAVNVLSQIDKLICEIHLLAVQFLKPGK